MGNGSGNKYDGKNWLFSYILFCLSSLSSLLYSTHKLKWSMAHEQTSTRIHPKKKTICFYRFFFNHNSPYRKRLFTFQKQKWNELNRFCCLLQVDLSQSYATLNTCALNARMHLKSIEYGPGTDADAKIFDCFETRLRASSAERPNVENEINWLFYFNFHTAIFHHFSIFTVDVSLSAHGRGRECSMSSILINQRNAKDSNKICLQLKLYYDSHQWHRRSMVDGVSRTSNAFVFVLLVKERCESDETDWLDYNETLPDEKVEKKNLKILCHSKGSKCHGININGMVVRCALCTGTNDWWLHTGVHAMQ